MKKDYNYGLALLRIILCFEVVMCHFFYESTMKSLVLFPLAKLRSFAAPTFFFLSFYLVSNKLDGANKDYIVNRTKRIIIPFTLWNIVYWILFNVVKIIFDLGQLYGLKELLLQVLFGHCYNPPMWFMWDMAVVTILFWVSLSLNSKYKAIGDITLFVICLGCVALQYSKINYGVFWNLPTEIKYSIGRVAEMIPIAYIAYLCSTKLRNIFEKRSCSLIGIVVSIILVYVLREHSYIVESFGYAGIVVMLITFLQVLFFYSLPFYILPTAVLNVIKNISQYTMGIYCLHFLVGTIINQLYMSKGIETYTITECILIFAICFIICFALSKTKIKYVEMMIK